MKSRKILSAMFVLLSVIVTSCGSTPAAPTTGEASPTAVAAPAGGGEAAPAATDEKVTLKFWKMPGQGPDAETAYYADLIKKFNAEHPNITVEHLIIPWDSGLQKYTATLAGNDVPDVTYQIVPWLNSFRGQGALTSVESLGNDSTIFSDVFKGVADGSLGPDGNHYGVPYYGSQFTLVVNEAVWERAGKPAYPKTYEEMIPFAQKLTFDKNGKHPGEDGFDKNNIDVYGWSQPGYWSLTTNYIWNYLWAYGVDSISEDGKDIGFNNDQGKAALKVMKDMVDSGAATPINLYPDATSWNDALPQGRIGMSWYERLTPETVKAFPDVRLKVIETPAGPAGTFAAGGAGYLAIPTKSKHKAEALEFIKFLTAKDNVRAYLKQTQLFPVVDLGGNVFEGIGEPYETFMNDAVGQAKYVRLTRVGLPYNPEEAIISEINNYLIGQKDLDQMLSDLSQQVQTMSRNAGM